MSVVKFNGEANQFYPFLVKSVDEKNYLYNIATNAIFLMDENAYEILVNDADINQEKYKEDKSFFENNYILVTPDNNEKLDKIYNKTVEKKNFINASSVTLMVSQECNLRCKYCYGENGEYSNKGKMNLDTAIKAVDYLVQNSTKDELGICFFGGEPLMNFELIEQIVDYVREIERTTDKVFRFTMTTNGTLIDQKIEDYIIANKILLTVSIDGPEEMNDANRYYANQKGAYSETKKNTKRLGKMITARATLAPPNYDVHKSIKHLVDNFGFQSVAWAEADNLLSDDDYDLLKASTLKLFDELEELIVKGEYKTVKKYHSFMNLLVKFYSDGIRTKGCGAGSNMIAVDIDGKVYPCHRFVGIEESIIGNVSVEYMEGNTDFFSKVDLKNFKKCDNCMARSICGGGCINENHYASQSINEPSEKHCKYKIALIEKVLEIYIRLDEEAKEQLFGTKKN